MTNALRLAKPRRLIAISIYVLGVGCPTVEPLRLFIDALSLNYGLIRNDFPPEVSCERQGNRKKEQEIGVISICRPVIPAPSARIIPYHPGTLS